MISISGFVHRFSDSDLSPIKVHSFEFIIRFGTGIFKGGILNATKIGVISFHHWDSSVSRGGPPGWWEVYNLHNYTGSMIQNVKEELDGDDIIYSCNVVTSPIA